MVDGTGMCGACRVTLVVGRTRASRASKALNSTATPQEVDFDEAMRHQGMYRTQEQRAAAISQAERQRQAGHQT